MFALFQIPIADGRRFVTSELEETHVSSNSATSLSLRLHQPRFPRPKGGVHAEFIRNLGAISERRKSAIPYWTSDASYCKTERGIRFGDIQPLFMRRTEDSQRILLSPVTRRLFSDGMAVSKLEVGFSTAGQLDNIGDGLSVLIEHLLDVPIRIRRPQISRSKTPEDRGVHFGSTCLAHAGRYVADLYAQSTTPSSSEERRRIARSLVAEGSPSLYLEFDSSELRRIPKSFDRIEGHGVHQVQLGFRSIKHRGETTGVWVVIRNAERSIQLRNLRLCLSSLYAEREVLNNILGMYTSGLISYSKSTYGSDKLEEYVLRVSKLFTRPYYGINKVAIGTALQVLSQVPGRHVLEEVQSSLSAMRRQNQQSLVRLISSDGVLPLAESSAQEENSSMKPYRVFVSYSHNDERDLKDLERHLSPLKRQGLIETWSDRSINPGQVLDQVIDQNLAAADVVILLVSASFVNSDYCYSKEMDLALARHRNGEAIVVPIVVKPVDYTGLPFANLLMLPKDAKAISTYRSKDTVWSEIARSIRKLIVDHRKSDI